MARLDAAAHFVPTLARHTTACAPATFTPAFAIAGLMAAGDIAGITM